MLQNYLTQLENERAESACRTLRSMDLKSKTSKEIESMIEANLKKANVSYREVLVDKSTAGISFTVHLRKFYVILLGEINEYLEIPAGLEEFERTECEVRHTGGIAL